MESIIERIEKEIAAWHPERGSEETGIVRATGDGIAEIDGLANAVMTEMVLFDSTFDRTLEEALKDPKPIYGLVLNLEEDGVRAVILGDASKVYEGMLVRRVGRLLSIPVGEALVGRVVKWIYRNADAVFVQSRAFVEPVAELCAREKIVYYPNSAEDAVASISLVGECPIPALKQCFSVVFAGALGTAQALDVILDAAEKLRHEPSIRFFLVGHGSRSEWVAGQLEARQLDNVVLAGRYPIEAMPSIFAGASVLLVTLTNDPIFAKTVPSKVQSYLAAARPIIGCMDGEGARVIDEAQAGVTCAAMDVDGLVSAIEQLYRMPEGAREQLGDNGRKYFESHFESRKLTTELIDKFRSIIEADKV